MILTTQQVAEKLDISVGMTHQLRKTGKLRPVNAPLEGKTRTIYRYNSKHVNAYKLLMSGLKIRNKAGVDAYPTLDLSNLPTNGTRAKKILTPSLGHIIISPSLENSSGEAPKIVYDPPAVEPPAKLHFREQLDRIENMLGRLLKIWE